MCPEFTACVLWRLWWPCSSCFLPFCRFAYSAFTCIICLYYLFVRTFLRTKVLVGDATTPRSCCIPYQRVSTQERLESHSSPLAPFLVCVNSHARRAWPVFQNHVCCYVRALKTLDLPGLRPKTSTCSTWGCLYAMQHFSMICNSCCYSNLLLYPTRQKITTLTMASGAL